MPYDINLTLAGDVAIAIWFGSYNLGQRIQTQPALTYCFHTAFVEAGAERVSVSQLDVVDGSLFPPQAARNFFLDIKLEDAAISQVQNGYSSEYDNPADVQWMRTRWRDTVTKMYGAEYPMRASHSHRFSPAHSISGPRNTFSSFQLPLPNFGRVASDALVAWPCRNKAPHATLQQDLEG